MHPSLREQVRALARARALDDRRLEEAGRDLVLCPPDCPGAKPGVPHAHTWWDMWRLREKAEYECQLRRAQHERETLGRVDVSAQLHRMGVGSRHVQALHALDEERPALVAMRRWLAQPRPLLPPDALHAESRPGPLPRPWLLLMGAPDAGKTQAAVAALAHFTQRYPWGTQPGGGRPVPPALFVPGADLASMEAFTPLGAERLDELQRTQLLVLDDLGAERLGEVALSFVHHVLDARYRNSLRTIITTHLARWDFLARFDGWKPSVCAERLPSGARCSAQARPGYLQCPAHHVAPGERAEPGRLERRLEELAIVPQLGRGKAPPRRGDADTSHTPAK